MSLTTLVYLASIASGVLTIAITILVLVLTMLTVTVGVSAMEDCWDKTGDWIRRGLKIAGIAAAVLIFVPSEKTIYTMLAAYGVESIAASEQVQRIAPKSLEYLEAVLDERLGESNE